MDMNIDDDDNGNFGNHNNNEENEDDDNNHNQKIRRSTRQTGSNKKRESIFKLLREKRMKRDKLNNGEEDDDNDNNNTSSNNKDDDDAYNEIYDVVDEDTYRSIVKKRREAGDFIVDDDGAGYADDGEEHYWDKNGDYYSDNESVDHKKSTKNGKKLKNKKTQPSSSLKKKNAKSSKINNDDDNNDDGRNNDIRDSDNENNDLDGDNLFEKKKPKSNIKSLFAQLSATKTLPSNQISTSKSKKQSNEESLIETDDQLNGMLKDLLTVPNSTSSIMNSRPMVTIQQPIQRTFSRINRQQTTSLRRRQHLNNIPTFDHHSEINQFDHEQEENKRSNSTSKPIQKQNIEDEYDLGSELPHHYRDDDNNNDNVSEYLPKFSTTATSSSTTKALTYTDEQIVIPQSSIVKPGEIEEIEENGVTANDAKQKLFATMKSKPIQSSDPLLNESQSLDNNNGDIQIHVDKETGESYVDVYWLDMYEDKNNAPGSVFIFGKVRTRGIGSNTVTLLEGSNDGTHTNSCNQFSSIMIEVKNIQRTMYVLPRDKYLSNGDDVSENSLKQEITEIIRKNRSPNATGPVMKTKFIDMNYAFEMSGVPREIRKYLLVQYPMANEAKGKFIPLDIAGDTFSHIFGSNQSAIEQLVLSLHLMGPSWIRIKNPIVTSSTQSNENSTANNQLSWCKNECLVENPIKQITKLDDQFLPPTLRILSLSMKTTVNRANHQHEIVSISCFIQDDVALDGLSAAFQNSNNSTSFTIIRSPGTSNIAQQALSSQQFKNSYMNDPELQNKIFIQPNERALLNFLCAQFHRKDPDVIIGHNISGFELDVLLTRMQSLKVSQWSKIGRLKRSVMPRHSRSASSGRETHYGVLTPGRLVLDTYQTARELLLGQNDYTLSSLCETQKITMYRPDPKRDPIPYRRDDIDPSRVPRYFEENKIVELIKHSLDTAKFTLQLAFRLEALPLTLELTTLGGNLWRRTLEGGRSERIEYLLLHSFQNKGFVVPDKFDPNLTQLALESSNSGNSFSQNSKFGNKSKNKGNSLSNTNNSLEKKKKKVGRQKPAYSGGLVLDPEPGLYDNFILLLDFNSLYPSIIQEYNICFTTIERPSGLGPGNSRSIKNSSNQIKNDDENNNDIDLTEQTQKLSSLDEQQDEFDTSLIGRNNDNDNNNNNNNENDDDLNGLQGEIEQGVAPSNESEAEMLLKIEPPPDEIRFGKEAVLPAVIRSLVERRRAVKAELKKEKNPARKKQLDVRQKALKITANSMYGCLGFTASRFYAKPLASLVTRLGRDILQRTVKITGDLGYKVVYGDTDSIMVNTNEKDNVAKVKEIASQIISSVNKQYRKLELDMDGMMQTLLLCKKKKYAALMVVGEEIDPVTGVKTIKTEKETKGLDLVRRDWCPLSRKLGHLVLDQILSGKDRDEVLNAIRKILESLATDIRSGSIPLIDFQVTKGLNKSPNDYPDIKGQPHLQVAMAMMKAGKIINTGDHIPYVICKITREEYEEFRTKQQSLSPTTVLHSSTESSDTDSTNNKPSLQANQQQQQPIKAKKNQGSFADRAFHPNEVRESGGKIEIDHEWYLATQIMPPIQRLCDPIDGISHAELAALLGLDASKYRQQSNSQSNRNSLYQFPKDQMGVDINDEFKYKDCEKVLIDCDSCGYKYIFPGIYWMPDAREKEKQKLLSLSSDENQNDLMQSQIKRHKRINNLPTSFSESISATLGLLCPCCSAEFEPIYLQNILQNHIFHSIEKYQQAWAIPDDHTKEFRTRQRSVKEGIIHHEGKRIPLQLEYNSSNLNNQISYIFSLVDIKRTKEILDEENKNRINLKKPTLIIQKLTKQQEKSFKAINLHLRKLYKFVSDYRNIEPATIFDILHKQ